jgi:glycosyltransferase involved in cell wall biosynthesis
VRIVIVTEVWQPTTNGVVTRLTATIEQLLVEGHQVLVIAPAIGSNAVEETGSGLTVRTVPTIRLRSIYGGQPWGLPLPRVARYLAEFDPDVVHVVNPAVLGIAGVIAARRQKRALVCSYHTDLAAYTSYYHLGWLRPIIWWIQRRLYGAAALTMVTSERSRSQLSDAGIQSVSLWPRGVDLDRFRPPAAGSAAWPRIALYVGRLAEEKDLDGLGELTCLPDTHLVVVGDGPSRARLEQTWASGSVTFLGFLGGEQLASVYRQSAVFVFPSTAETLGLVLIEALASGLPAVAADSPASREVLSGCCAARMYTPGPGAVAAAISELLGSAPRSVLSQQACAHVVASTWEAATDRLTAAYRTALHSRQRPGQQLLVELALDLPPSRRPSSRANAPSPACPLRRPGRRQPRCQRRRRSGSVSRPPR